MGEDDLLEKTLVLAENESYEVAYHYLLENKDKLIKGDYPRVWYFLTCLSSGIGKNTEAIRWFKKAVDEYGYWYRPEILEDVDLQPLFLEEEFIRCREISDLRYNDASVKAKTQWSWQSKKKDRLMLCLHGNGQKTETALQAWRQLEKEDLQVEIVQSHTVDSYERFRWNYDDIDYKQVVNCSQQIRWEDYSKRYLAGFSAGCDMILRIITYTDLKCDEIFLQSPWIPFSKDNIQIICKACYDKKIGVHIYCGELDHDCKELADSLYLNLKLNEVKTEITWQKDLRHQFRERLGKEYKAFQ